MAPDAAVARSAARDTAAESGPRPWVVSLAALRATTLAGPARCAGTGQPRSPGDAAVARSAARNTATESGPRPWVVSLAALRATTLAGPARCAGTGQPRPPGDAAVARSAAKDTAAESGPSGYDRRLPLTLCGNSFSCATLPCPSNGTGWASREMSSDPLPLATSASAFDTHSSATSNVFGMMANFTWSRFGCQQVSIACSMHSRSVGNP